jgi:chaperonin GroES
MLELTFRITKEGHAMQLKPLYNRVLVQRLESKKNQVKGEIIIPDIAKEKPMEGKIVAVGAGKLDKAGKRIPLQVKVGDRVLIGKYSGQEVMIEEVEHLILKEDEILGIVG